MKAAYFESVGAPDVIKVGELPAPEPKPGEVRVRVLAASINPIDTYIRSGAAPMQLPKPAITGTDFAGLIDAVGSGVTRFKPGERVWGSNQGLLGRPGTCAEFICVEEQWLYPTPQGVSDEQAAAGALVGITAHLGLFFCAKLQPREWVFVNGGTGGVGSMVFQMAKAAHGSVITTVGSDEKARLARNLGADVVINYKTEDVSSKVKEAAGIAGVQVWYRPGPHGRSYGPSGTDRCHGRAAGAAGVSERPVLCQGADPPRLRNV